MFSAMMHAYFSDFHEGKRDAARRVIDFLRWRRFVRRFSSEGARLHCCDDPDQHPRLDVC